MYLLNMTCKKSSALLKTIYYCRKRLLYTNPIKLTKSSFSFTKSKFAEEKGAKVQDVLSGQKIFQSLVQSLPISLRNSSTISVSSHSHSFDTSLVIPKTYERHHMS